MYFNDTMMGEGGEGGGVESPPHPPLVILTEKACVDEG